MIEYTTGNLLKADAEALVNTVNCVGFMGKGIALQFKQAFPENFKDYERACKKGEVKIGAIHVHNQHSMINPKYIFNFPTKNHWKGKSKIEDIESGLISLLENIKRFDIESIAIPPLGCGLGGLEWNEVRPLITDVLLEVPNVKVLLFSPQGAPIAKEMPVRTSPPRMTLARAFYIKLIQQYQEMSYQLTLLEMQKLAYFLQVAGEPLKLNFEEGKYGPYAKNLNYVLERIEGHFIRGYGDSQKHDQEIELINGAIIKADQFIENNPEANKRLNKVADLIEGFETPYGMELLASTHWIANKMKTIDEQEIIYGIQSWNERKKKIFQEKHIKISRERLIKEYWL